MVISILNTLAIEERRLAAGHGSRDGHTDIRSIDRTSAMNCALAVICQAHADDAGEMPPRRRLISEDGSRSRRL
jgi:hypothetical protein